MTKVSKEQLADILEKHQLRKTDTRLHVLTIFFNHEYALAHSDLEKELGRAYDRVTIYRTLNTFEEAGIIHQVPAQGETRFALCHSACDPQHHQDQHLHFNCSSCDQIFCLEEVHLPAIAYPRNYEVHSLNITATGICKSCKNKNSEPK
ncbi:MAG: Fur family transcriptional regulator [Chitinophagaceae bacterium]|nr:Fur family transcriptional regulator [Chitinophagaceae bacterium]